MEMKKAKKISRLWNGGKEGGRYRWLYRIILFIAVAENALKITVNFVFSLILVRAHTMYSLMFSLGVDWQDFVGR